MKNYLLTAIIAFLAFNIHAQDKNEKPFLTKSFSNAQIKKVNVETSGGNISVSGSDAGESRVEVFVHQNNYKGEDLSKDEIQKRLAEDYTYTIEVNGDKLTAVAKAKTRNMNWKKALNISIHVFVPQAVSTDLQTSGGSIELNNLSGDQDFTTSGGSLTIMKVSGNMKGRTSGGSIHLADSKDKIDLETSGGSIHADNCTGDIKLETSGGSLDLTGLQGKIEANTSGGNVHGDNISGELTAQTSGGNIELSAMSCSLETSTSGGNIRVAIKQLGKYVTISNSGGNIDLKMPGDKGVDLKLSANKIKTDVLNNFSGRSEDDELVGTLNGGGVPVKVESGSGKINLSFN